jgi:hypothetical protein
MPANSDGLFNNPVEELFADVVRSPFDFLDALGSAPQSYVDSVTSCFADPRACEESFCAPFAACCVATGSCCMALAAPPLPDLLQFASCSGGSVEDCAASAGFGATTFGEQTPFISERGLVPNGSSSSESGALVGDPVNLGTQRVSVEARFAPPVGCNGNCLESAGVGFTRGAGDDFEGAAVGLLFSGSREQVSLLVDGQAVDSFESGGASTIWTLLLSPTGTVEVVRDGSTLGVHVFDPASLRTARLAVFGRSLFSSSSSAAIARIATTVELCDSPRGWVERVPVAVTLDGTPDLSLSAASEPSLLDDPSSTTVAFELDGEIYLGEMRGDTIDVSSLGTPLAPGDTFDADRVGEPELFVFGNAVYLYYTAVDASGRGSIGAARLVEGELLKDAVPVLAPEGEVVSYESPTVRTREGLAVLIVRATLSSGATELRAFYTSDPATSWEPILDGTLEALTRVDDPTEEITAPSLIVHNSAYQLYYSRRLGTRWTVEVTTSDELLYWRPLGESLGPGGDGFDALGARGLDARSGQDQIDALYVGQDGVSFSLGRALRPAPSDTASTAF